MCIRDSLATYAWQDGIGEFFWKTSGPGGDVRGGVRNLHAVPGLNVYASLPYELNWSPSDDDRARLRRYMISTNAGNPAGERLDQALEALAIHGAVGLDTVLIVWDEGRMGKTLFI